MLAAGDPDLSFGVGGKSHTGSGTVNREALDVAVQADGKVVVVGYELAAGSPGVFADDPVDFVVRRYNADGTPDASFGTGGTVVTDFLGRADLAQSVAVDSAGRIVVGGMARPTRPSPPAARSWA